MQLLNDTTVKIQPLDEKWQQKARERLGQLTMPYWALGRLMDLAEALAGMTRSLAPELTPRTIITMAGDHGVVAEGVSKFPQEVTAQMVYNFVNDGAAVNALAAQSSTDVKVVDMGVATDLSNLADEGKIMSYRVAPGTADMMIGPAMSRDEAIRAVEAGIENVNDLSRSYNVFGTGEMGIGNTTPSTAVSSALTGVPVNELTGRGTGIEDEQLKHKIDVIEEALRQNCPDPQDPIDVLAKVGGFEIGGIAGVILGAAANRKPVVVDGFISTAGALLAQRLCPQSVDYMIMSHLSVEPGHQVLQKELGKEPLLDLSLRLGEGTGGALAMNILDAAVAVLADVATFEEAAVSER